MPASKPSAAFVCALILGPGFLLAYIGILRIFDGGPHRIRRQEDLNISVGVNLASSYGTIALRYPDGTFVVSRTSGNEAYRQVMARLSLASSQRNPNNFFDLGEALRYWRKLLGLPATADVGNLGNQLRAVTNDLEDKVDLRVTEVLVTIPHLLALYEDDVEDACEWAGLKYTHVRPHLFSLVWETSMAFGGYGFGLCEHWDPRERCQREEENTTRYDLLAVHYSDSALTTSSTQQRSAYASFEPDWRHSENFTLGYAARNQYKNEGTYWQTVHDHLRILPEHWEEPNLIILTGDAVEEPRFQEILKEAVTIRNPQIVSNDSVYAAAKGAAEIQMRSRVENHDRLPLDILDL